MYLKKFEYIPYPDINNTNYITSENTCIILLAMIFEAPINIKDVKVDIFLSFLRNNLV